MCDTSGTRESGTLLANDGVGEVGVVLLLRPVLEILEGMPFGWTICIYLS